MDISLYSLLLGIWVIGLFLMTLIGVSNKKLSKYITEKLYYLIVCVISGSSIIWALVYEYIYELAPCNYCWIERIFLFPLFLIALVSYIKKIHSNTYTIFLSSMIGLWFTLYHTYSQYSLMFFNKEVNIACSITWPSCISTDWVEVWWFLTIPAMWVLTFLCMIFLSIIAMKNSKKD